MKGLVYWGLFALVLFGAYSFADSYGYIPHSVEMPISAEQSWIVGETKECSSHALDALIARQIGEDPGYVLGQLTATMGHNTRSE